MDDSLFYCWQGRLLTIHRDLWTLFHAINLDHLHRQCRCFIVVSLRDTCEKSDIHGSRIRCTQTRSMRSIAHQSLRGCGFSHAPGNVTASLT